MTGSRPVANVRPLAGGYTHDNWLVDSARGSLVLKLRQSGRSLERLRELQEVAGEAARAGVPVAKVLAVGIDQRSGRPFMVQTYLPGEPGPEAVLALDARARADFFADFGRAIGRLHRTRSSWFRESGRPFEVWSVAVASALGWLATGAYGVEGVREAAAEIQGLAVEVDSAVRPAIAHRDLYLPNTVVLDGCFAGLLDFDQAGYWEPVHDFVKLSWWVFERYPGSQEPFRRGYQETGPAFERLPERLRIVTGLELLAGLGYWRRRGEQALLEEWMGRFAEWRRGGPGLG